MVNWKETQYVLGSSPNVSWVESNGSFGITENLKDNTRNIRFIDTLGSWRCFSGIGFECDSKIILLTVFSSITIVDGSATDFLACACFVVFFFSIDWVYIQ